MDGKDEEAYELNDVKLIEPKKWQPISMSYFDLFMTGRYFEAWLAMWRALWK